MSSISIFDLAYISEVICPDVLSVDGGAFIDPHRKGLHHLTQRINGYNSRQEAQKWINSVSFEDYLDGLVPDWNERIEDLQKFVDIVKRAWEGSTEKSGFDPHTFEVRCNHDQEMRELTFFLCQR